MHSQLLALLASSLLVRDAAAFPLFGKRAMLVVQDNVVVTELVTVTAEPDGSYVTGKPVAVGTATVPGGSSQTQTTIEVVSTTAKAAAPPSIKSTAPTSSAAASVPAKAATTSPKPATTTAQAATTPAPVKPTTTAAPPKPTTSAAPPVVNGSNKRGLAYNNAALLPPFLGGNSKVSWAYNWGDSSSNVPSGVEYVPMLWGLGSHTNGWTAAATKAIAAGSTHLLGFNEPDLGSQSNLSPADAAAGWKTYMQPFAGQAKLGSPAVTNGGSPMGVTWIQNFLKACTGCTVDYIVLHWYNGGDANAFMNYVTNAHAVTGLPVWISEFEATGNSDTEKVAFLNTVMPWLDSQSFVQRYSYFGVFEGNMLSSGMTPSAVGSAFAFN